MNAPPFDIIPGVNTSPLVFTPTYFIHNKIVIFLFNILKRMVTPHVNADCTGCFSRDKTIDLKHKGKKYDLAFKYKGDYIIFIEVKTRRITDKD